MLMMKIPGAMAPPARNRLLATCASALEEPYEVSGAPPAPEPFRQHLAGSAARVALGRELAVLCRRPAELPLVVGTERAVAQGTWRTQPMPFEHARAAAHYLHAAPATVQRACACAAHAQRAWERTPVPERCAVFERAADLLAGPHRQHVVAAAMLGSASSAGRAELDVRQLINQIRMDCHFLRDLARSRCVVAGGAEARNANQYHGLEGFWAAISPSDSVAAAQLALAPALLGNGVVWKPSDRAALCAHRVFETLERAGLPPGVINFVPCEENEFLEAMVLRPDLAGISFGGTSAVLERVWRRVGENVERFLRFPRIVGTGGARNFHVVHASGDLAAAAAGTARAAFEQAGQKATSCSRAYVARSAMDRFVEQLTRVARALVVCHPLDYRCFLSAVASRDVFLEATRAVTRAACEGAVVACGGRSDGAVGHYVEPTVLVVEEARHWLLTCPLRGPLLVLHAFPDDDLPYLEWAVAQAPFAMTGSVFAQDKQWARAAVGALRDSAAMLCVNERCSELLPGQQSLGGSRKSGNGAKVGSISCLLQYCSERSLREAARPCRDVTYLYMDECPAPAAPALPPLPP